MNKKIFTFILCMALFNFFARAQNVSYNLNSIPISGTDNTALGFQSLNSFTTGPSNVAIGKGTLNANTSGYQNIAIGNNTLNINATGGFNVAVGHESLKKSTGTGNTGLGAITLSSNTNGGFNTAIGFSTLGNATTGSDNTALGNQSLSGNTTGSTNTGLGSRSLSNNTTGSNNLGLGYLSNVSSGALTNATAIGSNATVNASNKIRLGNSSVTVVEGPAAYTVVSDGRFKTNISESDVKGLAFIKLLRPVVYNFDTKKYEEFLTQNMPDNIRRNYLENKDFSASSAIRQSGFIAQEVEKAAKEASYNFNGVHAPESKDDNYSLAYSQFTVPLVKAVQELSTQNDSLKKELQELRTLVLNKLTNNEGSIVFGEAGNSKLFQNAPNPFNQTTVIRYSIPATAKAAMITITSSEGKRIKEFDIKNNNRTNVEITGGQLSAGVYIYSLIVDGVLLDSKQMILTR